MPKERKLEKFVDNYIGIFRGIDGMITHQAGWISHKEIDEALKIKGLELTDSTIRTYAMLVHQALGKDSFLQESKSIKKGRKKIFRLTSEASALGDELVPKVAKSAYNIQNIRRRNSRNEKNGNSDQIKIDFEETNASEEVDMVIKVYRNGAYNVTGAEHVNVLAGGTDIVFVSKSGSMWRRMD